MSFLLPLAVYTWILFPLPVLLNSSRFLLLPVSFLLIFPWYFQIFRIQVLSFRMVWCLFFHLFLCCILTHSLMLHHMLYNQILHWRFHPLLDIFYAYHFLIHILLLRLSTVNFHYGLLLVTLSWRFLILT